MGSYCLMGTEFQFCKMKIVLELDGTSYILYPQWLAGESLGAQAIGFLVFIQSMRRRDIWGPKCTDTDTAGAGNGGGSQTPLKGCLL